MAHLGAVEAGQGDAAVTGHEDEVLVGHVVTLHGVGGAGR